MPPRFREQVGQALDLLLQGLQPFVESALRDSYGDKWLEISLNTLRSLRESQGVGETLKWDAQTVLLLIHEQWFHVFRHKLQALDRSLVNELREFRNRWAHQVPFSFEDAFRTLDTVRRLLEACGSPLAADAARLMDDVFRVRVRELEQDESGKTSKIANKGWWILLYAACAAAIVFQSWQAFGRNSVVLSIFVVAMFAFLAWQRIRRPPPVVADVQECVRCGRIIYGTPCPYCTAHRAAK